MKADDIRAEAIERIARKMFELDNGEREPFDSAYVPPEVRQHFRRYAAPFVDALGDLVPTAGYDSRGPFDIENWAGEIVANIPEERRYYTPWIPVERSGNHDVRSATEHGNNPNMETA